MKKTKWILGCLISACLVFGCNAISAVRPVLPAATVIPTAIGPTRAPEGPATPETALLKGTLQPLDEDWNDRALYKQGLIQAQQPAAERLTQASVYHLDIHIADDYLSLIGSERVRYTNQETVGLDAVYFQLFPNMAGGETQLIGVWVNGNATAYKFEYGHASLRVPLAGGLAPGQSVVLQLDFLVNLPTESIGNYGLFGFIDQVLVLDGFYPAIPVYDFRGWHTGKVPKNSDTTFQDASFYRVQVTAPSKLVMAASGVQVDRQEISGHQVVTFVAGPARDFYLAGSEQFRKTSAMAGGVMVNSYALVGLEDHAQRALESAIKVLNGYSERVGPYAYTEFDVLSTPMRGALGIEYPGIVGINKDMYLQEKPLIDLEATVAHEVGHQWFYNMIGNDQQNDPWLDEALTQFLTGTYYQDRYGTQGFTAYRKSWVRLWDRAEGKAMPIGLPADQYTKGAYSAIVYGRGPLFVEALAQRMGQTVFDNFLRDYFVSNEWGIVTPAVFKHSAEKHCACDLSGLFAEWVNP